MPSLSGLKIGRQTPSQDRAGKPTQIRSQIVKRRQPTGRWPIQRTSRRNTLTRCAHYPEWPGLEAVYLDDSWVLGIHESESALRFELEAVLSEDHPQWSPPKPGEQYAYLRLDLVFANPRRVEWIERRMNPIFGPDGEVDYGNIDSFLW
jgi:hypothetical protein